MARLGRYFVPDQPLHVIQRGNDRKPVFFEDDDYAQYRDWLAAASRENGLAVHAYVLMTNHVHLLATPETAASLPRTMQSLGRRYVRRINARRRRTGTLWEGRYRAAPIDTDEYFIACCRYIELNPVRARMVDHPRQYRWSSYRAHADGKEDALAAFHPVWRRLGRSVQARQDAYRGLIKEKLDPAFLGALRAATNGGWALGGEDFLRAIADAARRRAVPLPRGPQPGADKDARQMKLL
ncbi:MAG: transposase [Alphaproteobacteria bacterium]|nr:transposase [Alphaproteobacteria bacterium]